MALYKETAQLISGGVPVIFICVAILLSFSFFSLLIIYGSKKQIVGTALKNVPVTGKQTLNFVSHEVPIENQDTTVLSPEIVQIEVVIPPPVSSHYMSTPHKALIRAFSDEDCRESVVPVVTDDCIQVTCGETNDVPTDPVSIAGPITPEKVMKLSLSPPITPTWTKARDGDSLINTPVVTTTHQPLPVNQQLQWLLQQTESTPIKYDDSLSFAQLQQIQRRQYGVASPKSNSDASSADEINLEDRFLSCFLKNKPQRETLQPDDLLADEPIISTRLQQPSTLLQATAADQNSILRQEQWNAKPYHSIRQRRNIYRHGQHMSATSPRDAISLDDDRGGSPLSSPLMHRHSMENGPGSHLSEEDKHFVPGDMMMRATAAAQQGYEDFENFHIFSTLFDEHEGLNVAPPAARTDRFLFGIDGCADQGTPNDESMSHVRQRHTAVDNVNSSVNMRPPLHFSDRHHDGPLQILTNSEDLSNEREVKDRGISTSVLRSPPRVPTYVSPKPRTASSSSQSTAPAPPQPLSTPMTKQQLHSNNGNARHGNAKVPALVQVQLQQQILEHTLHENGIPTVPSNTNRSFDLAAITTPVSASQHVYYYAAGGTKNKRGGISMKQLK